LEHAWSQAVEAASWSPNERECTMEQRNIQRHENQAIRAVFDRAGDLRKVLIVGMDYAEAAHRVVVCTGQGDVLCRPLWVHNDREGLAMLEASVAEQCRRHGIEAGNVVFGGESPGSWAVNFVYGLQSHGHLTIDLHAQDVKKRRENQTTDDDNLSALTISQCLIGKMGREPQYSGPYAELHQAMRFQAKLTRELTRVQNRIHSCADVLFPGLMDSSVSGVPTFGEAGLRLLQEESPASVQATRPEVLARRLSRQGLSDPAKTATKLKALAERALCASAELQRENRWRLSCLIEQYRQLREQEAQTVRYAAQVLRQTPGALLTSVDGIGVKYACQLAAELGDPDRIDSADRKVNYFGLTERTHQTGGSTRPILKLGRQKRCDHFGKKTILCISDSVSRRGPAEYRDYHAGRRLRGKNARHALGRKLLRFAVSVLKAPHVYVPPEIRSEPCDSPRWPAYFRDLAAKMHIKWQSYPADPKAPCDTLKEWEDMANSLYKAGIRI
jgi:transposase